MSEGGPKALLAGVEVLNLIEAIHGEIQAQGISWEDLALKSDMDSESIRKVLQAEYSPEAKHLFQLIRGLGCKLDYKIVPTWGVSLKGSSLTDKKVK